MREEGKNSRQREPRQALARREYDSLRRQMALESRLHEALLEVDLEGG